MKNAVMNINDKIFLRKRAIVEFIHDELKNICQIEHSRHRSFTNFITNLIAGLIISRRMITKEKLHFCFQP
jgi:hypothetical protein